MIKFRFFKLILIILFIFKFFLSSSFAKNETIIIVKINNQIITNYDLEVEGKYLEALNPSIKTLTKEQKIKLARKSIIREKIKSNEILKYYQLGQDTSYLNEMIAENYKKLGIKNDIEFNNHLLKYNLTIDDIKKKFEIEASWNRLIFNKYKNQVEVDIEKNSSSLGFISPSE